MELAGISPCRHLIMYSLAKQVLNELNSNFIGIFLYGSQNYGLDNEESDKDAIIIVKENDKPHRQVTLSSGVVKIYTLRYFLSRLQKGDMECYEILYTKHRFINNLYDEIFDNFVIEFSKIINLDRIKHALALKLHEHLTSVAWISINQDNSKYHRKRVYWSYRVSDQLRRVIEGECFKDTFIYDKSNREELLKIKSIVNYLPLKKLDKNLRLMYQQLRELPKYDTQVTEKEEECLSNFYNMIYYKEE